MKIQITIVCELEIDEDAGESEKERFINTIRKTIFQDIGDGKTGDIEDLEIESVEGVEI